MVKYLYNVSYSSWEDSGYELYYFDKKLSSLELEEYVQKATKAVLEKLIKEKDIKGFYWGVLDFEIIFPFLREEMIKLCFIPADDIVEVNYNGYQSIVVKAANKEFEGKPIERLVASLPKKLKKQASEFAVEQDRLDEERLKMYRNGEGK